MTLAGAVNVGAAKRLGRWALRSGVVWIVLMLLTIPAALGAFRNRPVLENLSLMVAGIGDLALVVAVCLLSRSWGFHALWSLLLLFPPTLLFYVGIFPDRLKEKGSDCGRSEGKSKFPLEI